MRNIVRGCADFLDDRTLVSPAFPMGRCPKEADRRGAAGKTDEESGEVRGTCGKSVSP